MTEIEQLKQLAERLYETRKAIVQIEDEAKKHTEELKTARDVIQSELINLMNEVGLSSIKTASGENYAKAKRKGIAILNPTQALFWARDNGCYAIDKKLLTQKLGKTEELPECFEETITEYISVRKPKQEN